MNFQSEQIKNAIDYTSNLIQFSWTASALLLTAQGWLISKFYLQNRTFKKWHIITLMSCVANIIGMISLLTWYESLVSEALMQKPDLFKPEIVYIRKIYYWITLISIVLFGVGFFYWASLKGKLETKLNSGKQK